MPSSFDDDADFYDENRFQKFTRRLKEEPLIPFGCALTCWALVAAGRSIRQGDSHKTNRMFRARIYAQGFTLLCLVGGSYYYAEERAKRKVFDGAVAQRKAKEKNDAWIRELEARDLEEKELEQRKQEIRKLRQQGRSDQTKENIKRGDLGIVKSVMEEHEARRFGLVLEAVSGLWRR